MSVYAIIQESRAIGIKMLPKIKYNSSESDPSPNKYIKKLIESGSHGALIPIQEIPTNT